MIELLQLLSSGGQTILLAVLVVITWDNRSRIASIEKWIIQRLEKDADRVAAENQRAFLAASGHD